MQMPGRVVGLDTRFGFNGKHKDNEIAGAGNSLDFKFRGYDPRIGRFKSVDPLAGQYPWNNTYAFAENDVIRCMDLEGAERLDVVSGGSPTIGNPGTAAISITMDYQVVSSGRGEVVQGVMSRNFSAAYSRANGTYYMTQLPTATSRGTFLNGEQEEWAKNASKGGKGAQKYQDMLSKAGVAYYQVNVAYNYNISEGGSVEQVYAWVQGDRQGRGMIMSEDAQSSFADAPQEVRAFYQYALTQLRDPTVNGAGSNTSAGPDVGNLNIDVIREFTQTGPGNTVNAIHETGHNQAGPFYHGNNYEYYQEGLQSNEAPHTTRLNTKMIINDNTNRTTLR